MSLSRSRLHTVPVALLGALLLTAAVAPAAAQGRTDGARPLGLAGAFVANASGNGALYHNPAGVGTALMYAFEGQFLYEPGMNTFNASVVDSKINPKLAMGFAYSYEDSTRDEFNLTGHDFRLAVAHQLVPSRVVLGLGGRYLLYDVGDDRVLDGFTLDTGAVVRVTDGFFVGLSGNNLIDVCEGDDGCMVGAAPRTVGTGLAFGSSFGLQVVGEARADLADVENPTFQYAGGLEYLAGQILALRGGYRWLGATESNVIAAGAGFRSNAAGLDLAYQHNLTDNEYRISVALQLYVLSDGR